MKVEILILKFSCHDSGPFPNRAFTSIQFPDNVKVVPHTYTTGFCVCLPMYVLRDDLHTLSRVLIITFLKRSQ
jgi:hypothetical protein